MADGRDERGSEAGGTAGTSRRGFLQGSLVGAAGATLVAGTRSGTAKAAVGGGSDKVAVVCTVNGRDQAVTVGADEATLDTVRERLGLTGSKPVCRAGTCGACTVLVDDVPHCSCLLPAVALEGRSVTTIEGISAKGLHPVQRAFMAEDALQCGFCTPGFIVEAVAFHDAWRAAHGTTEPTDDQVAAALAGHLCRCGAYPQIYRAVQAACRGEHDARDPIAPRHDAREKVTGAARYTVDIRPDDLHHAAVIRSPHAHAVLEALDLAPAEGMEGVVAVTRFLDDGGRVRFAGQELAAVAARTPAIAEAARKAVLDAARFRVEAHVLDFDSALAAGAPVVFADARKKDLPSAAEGPVLGAKMEGNLRGPTSSSMLGKPGRADKKLEAAHAAGRVAQGTYETQVQVHTALEPHGAVAHWHDAGPVERGELPRPQLDLWISTQSVEDAAHDAAERWKLKADDVHVHAEYIGGGFGSKAVMSMEAVVAIELSKLSGKPVRCVLSRAEELTVGGNRPAQRQDVEVAWTADGALDAVRSVGHANSGAAVGMITGMIARLLYPSDDKRMEDYDVLTHGPPGKAFRGPGGPPAIFALEQVVDDVARTRGEDPIALRRRWDEHPGRLRLYDWIEGLPAWAQRESGGEGRYREGTGLACGSWFTFIARKVRLQLDASADGILASTAAQDMGNGSRSLVARSVAGVLGIHPQDVQLRFGHSDDVHGIMSAGSRTAASLGPAAVDAAETLAQEIRDAAADQLGWADAEIAAGGLRHEGAVVPWKDVLSRTGAISVIGKRRKDPGGYFIPFAVGGLNIGKVLSGAVQATRVEVDTWTGKVRVIGSWIGLSVGRIQDPVLARSQVQGGVVQGISYALYEERRLDPTTGQNLTRGMDDYRIAGIGDIGPIEVRFDDPDGATGDFAGVLGGGVGIGEVCTVPTAASIGNAVRAATGWRPTHLPIRPDRVLEGLS
ncbi:MAG: molybdopterin-dependent oxidoreductase [Alphaproteobacteria bacterium]|nr:molybdopterin-dependent oxidoreductase [Alphaproteobacteria bacterium]